MFRRRVHSRGLGAALGIALLLLPPAAEADRGPNGASLDRRPARLLDTRSSALQAERAPTPAQAAFRHALGPEGILDIDPLTGTPRAVARLDGFLTSPSNRDATDIVLDYVRAHADVFRLDADDLAGLTLVKDYTDIGGTRHLVWAQTWLGIPAYDNDLRASVTSDGRLVNVLGSPAPDLAASTSAPALVAARALEKTLRSVGRMVTTPAVKGGRGGPTRAVRFAGGHAANLVLLTTASGPRLAWRVTAHASSDEVYDAVVDAATGEVLRRASKVAHAGQGRAWDYYPGAASGGAATLRDFVGPGWLAAGAQKLRGPNAHVYRDKDDDNAVDLGEDATPNGSGDWTSSLFQFTQADGNCAPSRFSICSWRHSLNGSPDINWKQNTAQVFYFVNTFHDYLRDDPSVGFTPAAGSFEGSDFLRAEASDGVSILDAEHLNNANMFTPPNGQSPRMQMYLFRPMSADFNVDPTPDANGGDDAPTVYHEYAHGLSGRLVTYSDGWSALDAFQSGAMGEGWSDWYALDYLVDQGYLVDTATVGEVHIDEYLGNRRPVARTAALDCPLGVAGPNCGSGGYTLGDMGSVWFGGPEVHADGEIWSQTLWDLRGAVGSAAARMLITRGMELGPTSPSFLDMRNAILQADQVNFGGANRDAIWSVFSERGMGFFASMSDANDVTPVESFDPPPDPSDPRGSITGTVTDSSSGVPIVGVDVWVAGHASGFPDDLTAVTDGAGQYTISDVPLGSYPEVSVWRAGYDATSAAVDVTDPAVPAVADIGLRRNWASVLAGATLVSYTGPNNASICGYGPGAAFDQSFATGWASDLPTPRSIVVRLPAFVDVTGFAIDPAATCGDDESAGLEDFRIDTSSNGSSWSTALSGTFTIGDAHQLNEIPFSRNAVRYVRLTMLSNQGSPDFIDVTEFEVYGQKRPSCLGYPATIVGTGGAETLVGTGGRDVILAAGGDDVIRSGEGRDVVCGGRGADVIVGGGGADVLAAESGNDVIYARDGIRDTLVRGGRGSDRARIDRNLDVPRRIERLF